MSEALDSGVKEIIRLSGLFRAVRVLLRFRC